MKIPSRIKILYKEYEIAEEDNLHDFEADLFGQVDHYQQVIVLNKGAQPEQKKATLIHEVVHALDEAFSIGLEEKQVEQLGTGLYTIISDNPEMFEKEVIQKGFSQFE